MFWFKQVFVETRMPIAAMFFTGTIFNNEDFCRGIHAHHLLVDSDLWKLKKSSMKLQV
jgi:hypothetical protein